MKKLIAAVLAGLLALGLVGCSDGVSQKEANSNNISFVSENNDDSQDDIPKSENNGTPQDALMDTETTDAPEGDVIARGGMMFDHGGSVDITIFEEEGEIRGGALFALEGKDVLMDMSGFYASIMVFEELGITSYTCTGFADGNVFIYLVENSEFSSGSIPLPEKFASVKPDEENTVDMLLALLGTIEFMNEGENAEQNGY